jgi:peptidoglycan/LPS O-acetylase OafA/YrhL
MQSRGQIASLTGLRFFAAALVVVFHFARVGNRTLAAFIEHGAVGVMVFFVLSGFILSYSYSLAPGSMKGNLRSFWVARFARLYPVYLLGIVLFVPILVPAAALPGWHRIATAILSLTVTQAWFHLLGLPWGMWNPPGWSLSAEAFFYVIFPLVCLPLSRASSGRLLAFAAGCWVLSVLGVFTYSIVHFPSGDFWPFVPLIRLPEFLLGMAAGLAWKRRTTQWFDRAAPYLANASALALLGAMCVPLDTRWFFSGALSPLAALLICSLACGRGLLARVLSLKPVVLLGGASYSLYILHWPIWVIARLCLKDTRFATEFHGLYFLAYFGFTTVAACLCFLYVEEPMNRILRRRWLRAVEPDRQDVTESSPSEAMRESLPSKLVSNGLR